MRAALILVTIIFSSSLVGIKITVPAHAKPWQCVLWPKSCQVPDPLPAPEPPAAQQPSQAAPPVVPKPTAKSHPRIKSKFAKPKRKAALPSWCKQVPSWASVAQMQSEATKRGHVLTSQQAQACLDSKKG